MSDLLLVGADVVTMDPDRPGVEAILVRDGVVVAVGTESEVATLASAHVERLDLEGATVLPGLIESHVHPAYTGLTDLWADCRSPGVGTIPDLQAALAALPVESGAWIRGWGYDDTLLAEGRHPTRDDLDAVSSTDPVIVSHISGHFLVANTVALALARVDEETVAIDDPRFPRDASGRLTGMAWEIDAVSRVLAAVPALSDTDLEDALLRALSRARERGITTVHDLGVGLIGGPEELDAYRRLDAEGRLPVRVVGFLRGDLPLDGDTVFEAAGQSVGRFRLAGAKFWADGSIQGLSAALRAPYLCDPGHHGELLQPQEVLDAMVAPVAAAGGQLAVHANGDAAVGAALTAINRAGQGTHDPRHRIEHCQVTSTADLDALKEAGVGVSFFVNHVYFWGDRHRERFLGDVRSDFLDPLASAAAAGLRFGLHSDCPITPMDPLATLRTAVNRLTSGGSVLGAAERIDVHRAVQAMTVDSAYLVHEEQYVGTLAPGMRADLVVLDGDLSQVADAAAPMPKPVRVMVGGSWE
ncbi:MULTISPECIES: amidohydrolase [unclassified Nocardioides]|uniref:amidohydrolase n=1 Tax=unclassified Nocardioides TaxID=2615069 RepID=UPI00070088F6|nr:MULTISPECIES: amidohydrolase [unclassified Nocardioides]KQY55508.1 hydrolase [Nocardioides sp. Root140]KRF12755.1 hydrolase [Nocardioides sp. Soil796]